MDIERDDLQQTDGMDVPSDRQARGTGQASQAGQAGQRQQTAEEGDVTNATPQPKDPTDPSTDPLSGQD